MATELDYSNVRFERQVCIPITYRGGEIGDHRVDLIVEKTVVVELKSVERFDPVFEAQILTYLRITKLRVGLLINFNSHLLHQGIKRYAL